MSSTNQTKSTKKVSRGVGKIATTTGNQALGNLKWRLWARAVAYVDLALLASSLLLYFLAWGIPTKTHHVKNDTDDKNDIAKGGDGCDSLYFDAFYITLVTAVVLVVYVQLSASQFLHGATEFGLKRRNAYYALFYLSKWAQTSLIFLVIILYTLFDSSYHHIIVVVGFGFNISLWYAVSINISLWYAVSIFWRVSSLIIVCMYATEVRKAMESGAPAAGIKKNDPVAVVVKK